MTGGMPKALSSRLTKTGTKGVRLFTVMNSEEAGVAVTPLAGEPYGAIDMKIVDTLLVGLFGHTPGVRVLTGRQDLWKNLLEESLIGINTSVENIKKSLESLKAVRRAA